MVEYNLVNDALNEIFLYLLKGEDGSGSGKVNSKWEITSPSAFDEYIDERNALYDNDSDLQHIEILKKGYPSTDDRRGIYVYTLSKDSSIVVDLSSEFPRAMSTVFVEFRIRAEETAFIWKYQDALTGFFLETDFGEGGTLGMIIDTYSLDHQDSANYSIFRIDFVLKNLSDRD